MTTLTSKETSTETVTKDGITVETKTTVEKTVEPSGKTTKVTTVVETTTNPDGSKSVKTTTSTEVSEGSPTNELTQDSDTNINEREISENMPFAKLGEEEKKNVDEFFRMTNEYRQTHGKDPFQLVDLICSLAKEHNDLMVAGKINLSHDGFSSRAKRIKNSNANAESVCCLQ